MSDKYYALCDEDLPLTLEASKSQTGPPDSSTVVGPNRKIRFQSETVQIEKSKVQGTAIVNLEIPDQTFLARINPVILPDFFTNHPDGDYVFTDLNQKYSVKFDENNGTITYVGDTSPVNISVEQRNVISLTSNVDCDVNFDFGFEVRNGDVIQSFSFPFQFSMVAGVPANITNDDVEIISISTNGFLNIFMGGSVTNSAIVDINVERGRVYIRSA